MHHVSLIRIAALCGVVSFLSACGTVLTTREDGGRPNQDGGPDRAVNVDHIPDAVPRREIRTIAGNKTPYRVLGKTYQVMPTPDGYREEGVASWYGTKFHGQKTSNGEIYDMYGMTAAHKTLPIPSYVRVTNKLNKKSVIVRVNDRGPFHGDRVIDLTYSAAKKLGFENIGTASVIVEYIDPDAYNQQQRLATQGPTNVPPPSTNPVTNPVSAEPSAPAPVNSGGYQLPGNTFLQVGAFSVADSAHALKEKLQTMMGIDISIIPPDKNSSNLYKVQIGPFTDNYQLVMVRQKLIDENFPPPHVVYR